MRTKLPEDMLDKLPRRSEPSPTMLNVIMLMYGGLWELCKKQGKKPRFWIRHLTVRRNTFVALYDRKLIQVAKHGEYPITRYKLTAYGRKYCESLHKMSELPATAGSRNTNRHKRKSRHQQQDSKAQSAPRASAR